MLAEFLTVLCVSCVQVAVTAAPIPVPVGQGGQVLAVRKPTAQVTLTATTRVFATTPPTPHTAGMC